MPGPKAKSLPKGTWLNKDDGRYYKNCPNPTKNPNCDLTQSYSRLDGLKSAINNNRPCSNCGRESYRGLRNPLPMGVWLDEQSGQYCRKCTFCDSIQFYDIWQSAKRGLQRRCDNCKYDIEREIKPLPDGTYYDETRGKKYYKYCPTCGKEIYYTERKSVLNALDDNTECRVCANQRFTNKRRVIYKDTFRIPWYKDFIGGAKKRNYKWELNMEDVYQRIKLQGGRCIYTGIRLTFATETTKIKANASIDRLNSNDHYHKDNICICLKEVNLMKQSLTFDEFIHYCKLVAKNHI